MTARTDQQHAKIDRARRERKRRKAYPYDYLEQRTGENVCLWSVRVQNAIARASGPVRTRGKYRGHSDTDPRKWIREITEEVIKRAGILKHKDRDENMGLAATLGIVLVAWYVRLHRAKAMDPRRPIELRRKALCQVEQYTLEVVKAMTVEAFDPALFPDQEWENPWDPKARDGKFV